MAISDIPILSMLRTRLEWGQARQRVLAENVANADTPNFRARDLKQPVVFDGRNLYDPAMMKSLGFDYYPVGRRQG